MCDENFIIYVKAHFILTSFEGCLGLLFLYITFIRVYTKHVHVSAYACTLIVYILFLGGNNILLKSNERSHVNAIIIPWFLFKYVNFKENGSSLT